MMPHQCLHPLCGVGEKGSTIIKYSSHCIVTHMKCSSTVLYVHIYMYTRYITAILHYTSTSTSTIHYAYTLYTHKHTYSTRALTEWYVLAVAIYTPHLITCVWLLSTDGWYCSGIWSWFGSGNFCGIGCHGNCRSCGYHSCCHCRWIWR